MVNIILVDDHKIIRKSIKAILSSEDDFSIIGEAENGKEAIDLVEQLHPDILILDLMMPEMNGLEVVRRLCQKESSTRIIMLSMHSDESYIREALQLGANAYVLKESPPEYLITAIREVIAGRYYLSPPIAMNCVSLYAEEKHNNQEIRSKIPVKKTAAVRSKW